MYSHRDKVQMHLRQRAGKLGYEGARFAIWYSCEAALACYTREQDVRLLGVGTRISSLCTAVARSKFKFLFIFKLMDGGGAR